MPDASNHSLRTEHRKITIIGSDNNAESQNRRCEPQPLIAEADRDLLADKNRTDDINGVIDHDDRGNGQGDVFLEIKDILGILLLLSLMLLVIGLGVFLF